MHAYSFIVSLQANHPSSDLRFLSELFQMTRRFGWTIGDKRTTPKGTLLGGTRSASYWSARVTAEETPSETEQLEDVLNTSIAQLERHMDELQEFFTTGGTMNYFIALYGLRNYELLFAPELMSRLASAKIGLHLDVYPYERTS